MDCPNSKRQKHDNKQASSQDTQSIFSHNRRVYLEFLKQFNALKCRSVNTDHEDINTERRHLIGILDKLQQAPIPMPCANPLLKQSYASLYNLGQSGKKYSSDNIIDLDPDEESVGTWTHSDVGSIAIDSKVVVHSGNEDEIKSFGCENSSSNKYMLDVHQCLLPDLPVNHRDILLLDNCNSSTESQILSKQGSSNMDIDNAFDEDHHEATGKTGRAIEKDGIDSYEISCECIPNEPQINENYHDEDRSVDELEDFWRDMSVALTFSKTIGIDQSIHPFEKNSCEEMEDICTCNHDFLMKDDVGFMCRFCGLIQQQTDKIFEYSWKKRKQPCRTKPSEHRKASDLDALGDPLRSIIKVVPDMLSIHPKHLEQMKPHQLQGFNFLVKNLADESSPGGCILAHAPGSGKTFLLISFIQSFLMRYPAGRPLIVLPKSVLGNWKKEFLCWQVEDISLYDFYSSKANNRYEQLKILKLWEENRSILLLGYQQVAHMISDDSLGTKPECSAAIMCKEKLLNVPSLVILDEGHTSRNEHTSLCYALQIIKTPRKVVLSGTIFQNHVSEVFNILDLVRPNFLKKQKSRAIVKRVLTMLDMSGKSARSRNISDKAFCDLIQDNFEKDSNGKTRVKIIQNLRELTENVLHYYQGENLKELPGLVDFTVLLNMSTKQVNIMKGLVGANKFEANVKCNAASLHPCLIDVDNVDKKDRSISKRKMDSVIRGIDIGDGVKAKFVCNLLSLSEAAGEKVLVFSQYVRSLNFLESLVTRVKGWRSGTNTFQMHGGLSTDLREQAIEKFNNSPDAKVFFGSIKACGEGISLVGASRVVILDVHENPSVMRQAIGRAFRPGQSRMVYCYRLVAAGSLEEHHHQTAFKKERVSKLWFEWNEFSHNEDFELSQVDVLEAEDRFLESPALREDIKSLWKR